jgi:hypothetical protein
MTGIDIQRLQVRLTETEDQLKAVASRCDLLEDTTHRLLNIVTLLTELIETERMSDDS